MAKKKKEKESRTRDLLDCLGESYHIERKVCEARRKRNFKYCRRCPENTDQMSLFESPRQIVMKKKRRKRRNT